MNTNNILYFILIIHLFLCIRFSSLAAFRYSEKYHVGLTLLVIFIPFLGYFIALKRLKRGNNVQ